MTTHYIEEAERLCRRIAFIVKGRIIKIGAMKDLLAEAQKEKIIQFSLDGDVGLDRLRRPFKKRFRESQLSHVKESIFQVRSARSLDLMPFISFFDAQGIKVMEAKIIQPSLEEVFVKITGIEQDAMKREKDGKKS